MEVIVFCLSRQKLGIILENKMLKKLGLLENFNDKKCAIQI